MTKWAKFWDTLSERQSDNNIAYSDLVAYLNRLGWVSSSTGTSHRAFRHPLVPALINLQPRKDGKAKAYQVGQVRLALELYTGEDKDGWLRG
jgi:predicted RNA binding protein YcfA (HicA-like mRNA interferase family)